MPDTKPSAPEFQDRRPEPAGNLTRRPDWRLALSKRGAPIVCRGCLSVDRRLGALLIAWLGWLNWVALESVEGIAVRYRFWIWLAGMANAAILVLVLMAVGAWVARSGRAWINWLWGGCVGLVALGFYADLVLFRMMAIHLGTGFRLLVGNGWGQGLLTLEASGVRLANLWEVPVWVVLAFAGGVVVTSVTRRLRREGGLTEGNEGNEEGEGEGPRNTRKGNERGEGVSLSRFFVSLRCCCKAWQGLLICVGFLMAGVTVWEWAWQYDNPHAKAWEEMHRVMPFTIDLLHRVTGEKLAVGPLRPIGSTKGPVGPGIAHGSSAASIASRPDIFLFVLESVRRDHITREIALNLWGYGQDCVPLGGAVASANATHISWYSLLTSTDPLYFSMAARQPETWGSRALGLLRQAGYEIHALAATHLGYQHVDQIAFGPGLELASSVTDAASLHGCVDRPARDREIARRLIAEIPKRNGGRVFLVFLDSTHHDYYWPEDFPAKFEPWLGSWNYFDFRIGPEKLERIKNRYRNALHFVDDLFGSVVKELKARGRYDDAMIFVTGDHGEEFLEHGKLVHASELWREQIEVPFLLKLPSSLRPEGLNRAAHVTASHVDALPTIFDCLGIGATNLFDGQSIFRKRTDFALVVDDNGARDPYRFCLVSGDRKAWLRYRSDSTLIAFERTLYLVNLTDIHDRPLPEMDGSARDRLRFFFENFGSELSRLYPEWRGLVEGGR